MKATSLTILILAVLSTGDSRADMPPGLPDPTRPLDYVDAAEDRPTSENLVLTSVVIMGDSKTAVINGVRVRENENIGGAQVISIRPGKVVVGQGNDTQELRVHSDRIKQARDDL